MSSKVLSLYRVFDVQNLDLCLTPELLKFLHNKVMLKLQWNTTFESFDCLPSINFVQYETMRILISIAMDIDPAHHKP